MFLLRFQGPVQNSFGCSEAKDWRSWMYEKGMGGRGWVEGW